MLEVAYGRRLHVKPARVDGWEQPDRFCAAASSCHSPADEAVIKALALGY